jgi:hypothetical protein
MLKNGSERGWVLEDQYIIKCLFDKSILESVDNIFEVDCI